jgi:hypothetical protein
VKLAVRKIHEEQTCVLCECVRVMIDAKSGRPLKMLATRPLDKHELVLVPVTTSVNAVRAADLQKVGSNMVDLGKMFEINAVAYHVTLSSKYTQHAIVGETIADQPQKKRICQFISPYWQVRDASPPDSHEYCSHPNMEVVIIATTVQGLNVSVPCLRNSKKIAKGHELLRPLRTSTLPNNPT